LGGAAAGAFFGRDAGASQRAQKEFRVRLLDPLDARDGPHREVLVDLEALEKGLQPRLEVGHDAEGRAGRIEAGTAIQAKGLPYLGELCLANCRDLLTMIQVRVGRGLWGSCLGEWVQAGLATTELLMGSN